ncbi:lamina-associated polypeptide 2, isoforms beta/delta/epsilon/gamma isoform X2 [Eurytemora carolleeae]|uniref:lamina-associated polypeptide 2, isoforms beta/delta/epsilon/gamma isoform X2 n=1 Tax=Eurytemora carolleeae TaxID=1294199 RepID=UPI000C764DF5|nr:lamina-associated polypeptide 2, isoforms beta/delta/epsilon/gamma isoform X2 [Eurytemora carolleeae]|eukprot:XP_023333812.1 lamina-associated polypeptide 2, isoforms beta/delta/epsilon/gamma-like isoform X2 [Eurytemora affinis]
MASLTKEELKTALINHGISPPPASSRKDEFLALYEEHVKPVEDEAGEFSSDDEVTISPRKKTSQSSAKSTASSKSPKKGKGAKSMVESTEESSLIIGDLDLDTIDDDELFRLLKENGIEAGPIVASTRPFYKKRLALVLRGENGMNGSSGGEFSDTEPEDDQPSGITSPQVTVTTRTRGSASSSKSNKSLTKSPVELNNGLRKRMNLGDEIDSSLRNNPTPRRSIHSYKVTETTRQTIVKTHDGLETRDTVHTLEKSESKGEDGPVKSSFFTIKKLIIVLLVLGFLAALFVYSKQNSGLSADSILDSVKKTIGGTPAAPAPTPAPVKASPPPPEQPSIADV